MDIHIFSVCCGLSGQELNLRILDLNHSLAIGGRASHLAFLCLGFLICEDGSNNTLLLRH